jgi:polar amino acid transport system substrate-binding protein
LKVKLGLIIAGILAALLLSWWILSGLLSEPKPTMRYRIAIDKSWQSLQLYNLEQNITNFSEELAVAIAAQQNFQLQIVHTGADFLFSGLLQGAYNGILASLPVSTQSRDFIFSNPYLPLGPILVAPSASKIQSVQDLNGKNIGFIMGSETTTMSLYKNTAIQFIPYDYANLSNLVDDLLSNAIDGAILNGLIANQYAKRGLYQHQLKIVSPPLNKEGLGLIAKDNGESKKLIEMFNDGLKALQESGAYDQLLQKWDLPVSKKS